MNNHPPNDRRIGSGAVVTAWALVACLAGATLVATALSPARPMQLPVTEQAALHAGCGSEDAAEDRPDRALRD